MFVLCEKNRDFFALKYLYIFNDHILKCMSNNENVMLSYVAFITLLHLNIIEIPQVVLDTAFSNIAILYVYGRHFGIQDGRQTLKR